MLFARFRRSSERLATSFRWMESKPFPAASAERYSSAYERGGGYMLRLERESLFAWETLAGEEVYGDFVLEAEVDPDPSNGHSAIGVTFRHVNDENFYSFLLSTRGNFRVDLLFNNHPLPLVPWTPAPEPDPETRRAGRGVRIVGHGSRLLFHVDDEWVAEVEDETLPSGSVGFAAQNFAGSGRGVFRLRRFSLDARPLVVEREHLRGWYYSPVSPASRLRLAESLAAAGSLSAAAVQLRKALKDREGTTREHFLLARCYTGLSMNGEALAEIERVLAADPGHAEARLEKANLLYLGQRLREARDWLRSCIAADGSTAVGSGAVGAPGASTAGPDAWNLLGNAEYGLGNWAAAVDAYRTAIDLQPDQPLFLSNAARGLERVGRNAEAVELYLRAARRLFADEEFGDLSVVVARLRALAPEDPESIAMEAKMLYREGKPDEALARLQDLEARGTNDSAVPYLLGIILNERGRREQALPRFQRAAELEPAFPLYQFRLAEALHSLGGDPRPALDAALELAPCDPWANNLAGQLAMEEADLDRAVLHLRRARESAPAELDIGINLSEALSLQGKNEEALSVLEGLAGASTGNAARLANQRGNIHARLGDRAHAVLDYEEAIRADPGNPAYKENCAAACIEQDMVHRAEELLAQVEPEHPSPQVYNLIGQVAALKGERARAELAYAQGLGLDPGNPDITLNLALLHRERGNHDAARQLLAPLVAAHPECARARALLQRIRDERELRLACATCGREWWVPKELPPQPALRIRGEPPADAPAGQCPTCGAVYCVGCASSNVRDMRFVCPTCGEALKLSSDALKWLLERSLGGARRS